MSLVICLLEDPADEDKALEVIAASWSCVPPPSGMVAWWPLDETSGTTVTDIVGGHNGTAQPGPIGPFAGTGPVTSASWPPPTFPVGMVDNSLFFYGNRHVKVPHNTALDPGTGDFTIDAWVIYAAAGKGQFLTIVRKAGGGAGTPTTSPLAGSGYQLVIQDSSANPGQLSFNVKGSLGDSLAWNPITPNIWHHVAVTVQRTTGVFDASIMLYFDGATVAGPNAHLGNVANNWDLLIGGDGVSAGEIAVDEVEIFDRALTQQEIQDIYNAGPAGKCKPDCVTPPSGMVAWYPLDEQVGAIAVNDIAPGFNNVGTLYAANGLPTSVSATPGPPPAGPVPVTAPPLNLPSGMVGSALYFYGPYIEVADHQDLDFGTGSFSIDTWIYYVPLSPVPPGSGPVIAPIVDKFDLATNKGYAFYLRIDTVGTQLGLTTGDGSLSHSVFLTSIPPLTWTHVAATVKRPSPPAGVDVYINGAWVWGGSAVPGNIDNSEALWMGKSRLHTLFNAGFREIAIDELELFNRVLTPQEVQDLYNAGPAGKCKPMPGEAFADLGDAPDSTNHVGAPMTAYTSVPANFPTVYDPVLGAPYGPIHLNPKGLAWLGTDVSFENEADTGPDLDGQNDIKPSSDTADLDGFDDGVILPIHLPPCGPTQFQYQVTALSAATLYTNVWFDFNRDGDWEDIQKCPLGPAITGLASDWAVQNEPIAVGPGTQTLTTPVFGSFNPSPGGPIWMRITLTDVPIDATNGADGGGPLGGYVFGETEDYKVWIDTPPATILPGAVTQCPALETTCPAVLTVCPPVQTQCPAAPTTCPPVQTRCPALDTRCPPEETHCPGVETQCPPLETQCPSFRTLCPPFQTNCPAVETQCPPLETQCPSFRTLCPPFPTYCPGVETQCPPVSTSCPPAATQCPRTLTRCPVCVPVDLALEPTEKPDSVLGAGCPVVETDCPSITEYLVTAMAKQPAEPG